VRRRGPPSEIARLARPLAGLLDGAWRRMHWWIALMAFLYLVSGITIVRSNEVAVVLRWGRLVGDTPALQEHGPGLLFAFPRPVDEVIRVNVKHVWEVPLDTLEASQLFAGEVFSSLSQGYAVTGDHNIVHVKMVARFRLRDPAEWAFYGPRSEDVLRAEVTAAMVRSLGEMGIDRVLSDGRKELVATATKRAQAGLDAAHSGLELSSLELVRLAPPDSLTPDFNSVQSAYIGAETSRKTAQAFAANAIPQAQAEADTAVQAARAAAESDLAAAQGAAEAFGALVREYEADPAVVRERLYRDAVDRALGAAADIRWLPPPIGGGYHGMRVSISPFAAGEKPAAEPAPKAPSEDEDTPRNVHDVGDTPTQGDDD
jgi:modulator of FtsH protease HflK